MTEREIVSKQAIIDDLFFECSDRLVHEFFDYESGESSTRRSTCSES